MQRTTAAVVTKRELVAPDVIALTLTDSDGGLLPSWTPGRTSTFGCLRGAAGSTHCAVRPAGASTTASPCAESPTAEAVRLRCMRPSPRVTR
ncbi:putative phthalate 4,5-dioxygenase domain protein [Mycobacterium kansasii 732]|nr:putative phthalate 4,5-dioxygenase domain protein [Mycobacterium kansasii 732]